MKCLVVRAPINIAVIKYWGKRDDQLILPCNSSISVTISAEFLGSTTKLSTLTNPDHQFVLNGQCTPVPERMIRCIQMAQSMAKSRGKTANHWFLIESENTVPTGSGLASSASGYAALAYGLVRFYDLDAEFSMSELSQIARIGSGSACRSMFGGIVKWTCGVMDTGEDSVSAFLSDWDGLEMVICSRANKPKSVLSSVGMKRTVRTSQLFSHRISTLVPAVIEEMTQCIVEKDFAGFAQLTMKESNQFHAVCLDSYPPIFYLDDFSKGVIEIVHLYNQVSGEIRAGYTFDAGPHPVIFIQRWNVVEFLCLIGVWIPINIHTFMSKRFQASDISGHDFTHLKDIINIESTDPRIYHCHVGSGPFLLA